MPQVLSFDNVSFRRDTRPILAELSWKVNAGEVAAVIGPNGCGKSTLLRLAVGYLWPQKGRIELLGKVLGEHALAPLRAQIGILEANTVYPFDDDMTALDVVASGYFSALTLGYITPMAEQWEHSAVMLKQVSLGGREKQLYATLSTGQRLRCLLARALVRRPALLLLDEPTAGLDLSAREAVLATLDQLHGSAGENAPAIVTITHHLEELLPQTSNVLLMNATGNIVASGHPDAVLTDANLTAAYGVAVEVTRRDGRFAAHVHPDAWRELLS